MLSYYVSYLQGKIINLDNCTHHKKSFTIWAIVFEVSWHLGQTTNVTDRIATNASQYMIIIHYDRFDRNHGASSAFNAMVGSMFTMNGGISANLL